MKFGRLAILLACSDLLNGCAPHAEPQEPPGFRVRYGEASAVEVTNLKGSDLHALSARAPEAREWFDLLSVRVKNATAAPPLSGIYYVAGETLIFDSRYPLDPAVGYTIQLNPAALPRTGRPDASPIVFEPSVTLASNNASATRVAVVYPTADTLPENQLKFYLHFSAPMSRGEAARRVCLLDDAGNELDGAFLELDEELWNPEQTRLTLFIDPGRIKQEVKPRVDLGPVLETGKSFTLQVERQWLDAAGRPLADDFRKAFRVAPPDSEMPDPSKWRIEPPPAGSREPLTVTLPEPMDHAMLLRVVKVTDAAGAAVVGEVAVTEQETRWQFTPRDAWPAGEFRLTVDTALEDLAGNNLLRPFEVDVFGPITCKVEGQSVTLPFEIRFR